MSEIVQLYADKEKTIKAYPKTVATEVYLNETKNIAEGLGEKINKTDIVDDLKSGGTDKVLSAEQGKILNSKLSSINVSSNSSVSIVDQFKKIPYTETLELNSANATDYNSVSYGTPTITLNGNIVTMNGVINLKTTSSSVTTLGYITKWLLPVRPLLMPTTAFSSDFATSIASAFAIYGDRNSATPYGDLRLETKSINGKNTFVSLHGSYKAPFSDLNDAYDFSTKVNEVKTRKELNGDDVPITILITADTHWLIPDNTNDLRSKQLRAFNWLSDKINTNFNLILGDYMSEGDSESGMSAMENKWKAYRYMMKDNTLILKGNHDDASYNGLFDATKVISTNRMWDWSMDGKSGLNTNPLEPKNFYYYVDDPVSRTRHIMLNTVDIPYNTTGNNKYKGFDTFVIRQRQIEWLVNVALKVQEGWDVAVYGHHSLYENITPTDIELINRDVIKKVLIDFINGTDSTITSTTFGGNEDFACTITTNFSSQGARKLIGYFFGHHHKDFHIKEEGINHIGMASMKPYNAEIGDPWNRPQTGNDSFCAECIQIDTKLKKLYLTRFGFGTDRVIEY